jgi:hypothetical protein
VDDGRTEYNGGMANHPLNLALRFSLELAALAGMGYWGWTQHAGLGRWAWTILLPLSAAALWGVFRVPNDPGKALVAVPGWARLLLEGLYFGGATWCLYAAGARSWGIIFAGVTVLHYAISYDRVGWMLKRT